MKNRTLIQQAEMVLPQGLQTKDLLIEEGKIAEIADKITISPDDLVIDARNKYVLPGFIDIHNHGALGFDCSFGSYQQKEDSFALLEDSFKTGLEEFLKFNLASGTTQILATSLAAPIEGLEQAFRWINEYCEQDSQGLAKQLAGINVEGCFLKDPEFAGAQSPAYFYPPDRKLFEQLQLASRNRILMVNIPPEHGKTGLSFIKELKAKGIAVAGGHTGAYFDEFSRAIDAGLSISVHFFNGPSRSSFKPFQGGGALEAMLTDDRVSLELIVDGYHIAPSYARDAFARKGFDKCMLITDSVFVNGAKGIQTFKLGDLKGSLSENGEYLHQVGRRDALFGSVLRMDKGFSNVLSWLSQEMPGVWYRKHEALTLSDALVATSKMASENPARQLNLFDSSPENPGTGSLKEGKWADLLIADITQGEGRKDLHIDRVFLRGEEHVSGRVSA